MKKKNIKTLVNLVISPFIFILISALSAYSQTDILISGAKTGFPVAIPQLCDAGGAGQAAVEIPEIIRRNLDISGLFKVIDESAYIETPGKCGGANNTEYSDWTVIGVEGLVKADIKKVGGRLVAEMFLLDVAQQKAVVGKRYEADEGDYARLAHKFSNEILRYFTGQPGVFGSKILYVSKLGRFKDLFVMDMDGSNQRQITRDRGLALSPSWSPAGDKIVYTSYLSKSPELYLLPASGGRPSRITDRAGLELGAEFDPRGVFLAAAASIKGISKIAVFDLNGQIVKLLTKSRSIDVSPTWSPDGSQLAFCSNRAGGPQIYSMGSQGGNVKRVSYTGSKYCTSPVWSPKGDKIAYTCRANGNHIFVSNSNGTNPTQLTFSGNNEDPSWSPDGRFLVFSSNFGKRQPMSIGILSLLGGAPRQITNANLGDTQPAWGPAE